MHYPEQMVFEAFIGFTSIGSEMYSIGDFGVASADELCQKYEKIQILYLQILLLN